MSKQNDPKEPLIDDDDFLDEDFESTWADELSDRRARRERSYDPDSWDDDEWDDDYDWDLDSF